MNLATSTTIRMYSPVNPQSFGFSEWTVRMFHVPGSVWNQEAWVADLEHKGVPTMVEYRLTSGSRRVYGQQLFQNSHSNKLHFNDSYQNYIKGAYDVRVNGLLKFVQLPVDKLLSLTLGETDFTITAENKDIQVHKSMLSVQSTVFKTMLLSNMAETVTNRLEITDFNYAVVDCFVKMMYRAQTDFLLLSLDDQLSLLKFADKYQAPHVQLEVEKELENCLNVSTCLSILLAVDQIGKFSLREKTRSFVAGNMKSVLNAHKGAILEMLESFNGRYSEPYDIQIDE